MSVGRSATAAAVRELSCEDHLLFFSNGRDLQTFRNHYEVSCSHSPPSHSCTHRLYLLLLSGAQNKEGKMLKTVDFFGNAMHSEHSWTFSGE